MPSVTSNGPRKTVYALTTERCRSSSLANQMATMLVHSAICDGMDTSLMKIECGFTRGFAGMQMIGNTSEVCRDGKERARAGCSCSN